ncbi:hypothetical protein F7725_014293 [Dissostichus mawsoni]|uniref:Uncharacterized protein n=1 Tax=Dissostichus mawsoni TaxID=36200 RepID=A0A7J5YVR5_DISMA|nr:hypothetical protein F7725_014293 [Dissostichus mawsoni]
MEAVTGNRRLCARALLLITLIVLIVVAVRSPKKKSSKKSKKADTGNSYVSQLPVKAPLGANSHVAPAYGPGNGQSAFGNAGMPRIPRATTTSSWDGRTNLEMTPSNSRQNLIPAGRNSRFYEDNEDQYAQSRQSSLYARPQNDPYSQSRPQTTRIPRVDLRTTLRSEPRPQQPLHALRRFD